MKRNVQYGSIAFWLLKMAPAVLLALIITGVAWVGHVWLTEPNAYAGYYGKGMFGEMSLEEARMQSAKMAREDFRHGRYRHLVLGLRYSHKFDEYLLTRYQIAAVPVAGCIVDESDLVVAESYNSTMKGLLFARHGRDVFLEAGTVTVQ